MEVLRTVGKSGACILSRARSVLVCRTQAGPAPLLLLQQKRHYAESGNHIIVERDSEHTDIAVVKMNKKPVNSLSKGFMTEMNITLEKLENDSSCRGVILTSANPGIFSAGLDITDMYQQSSDFTDAFWRSLQDFWLRLYGSNLATVAAINGHSPAGGCLMAMSCDYRIMAEGKFTMGLNEVHLGIVAPFWFQELIVKTCGERQAEMALQLGTLFKPEQALRIGLVDELAPLDDVFSKAREHLVKWLKIPDHARVITKGMCRGPLLEKLRAKQEADIAYFSNFINKEAIQKSLGRYLESLKKK